MSTMRLYGGLIAVVSGGYSIYLSTSASTMSAPGWLMLALGIVVVVHGLLLFTPVASRLRPVSGIAMIVYSLVMLLNQWWVWTMRSPMGMMETAMTWDRGMIAIAVLMLGSGLIMTVRRDMM